ncbi:hypothetical protein [Granulicella sibirica]|uniref:Uncharacterized protein n=1 Tax=Granulicella sibirica TaxID=2479048 RepID=A0A4Q0SV92_9BACT|nr:hypothetical protein [Granulicella sibirica]RXH54983.1 hypothetical protein GRAN_4087 [Granulicella sibirica]
MSLSISAANLSNASYDPAEDAARKAPAIKPTTTQEIHTLASSGQPAALIASSLGVPVSQVDADLGITTSSTSQASALVALSGRLSVQA